MKIVVLECEKCHYRFKKYYWILRSKIFRFWIFKKLFATICPETRQEFLKRAKEYCKLKSLKQMKRIVKIVTTKCWRRLKHDLEWEKNQKMIAQKFITPETPTLTDVK